MPPFHFSFSDRNLTKLYKLAKRLFKDTFSSKIILVNQYRNRDSQDEAVNFKLFSVNVAYYHI